MTSLPSIFLSHGAPDLPFSNHPAKRFLEALPGLIGRPKAILMISAHWASRRLTIMGAEAPATVHDFAGWPAGLDQLVYPARTDLDLVSKVQALLGNAGFESGVEESRGFDHGTWIPMMVSWPKADIPLVQLSLERFGDPRRHFEIGQALAPLREEGILIIGSGATVHNLYTMAPEGTPAPAWAIDFDDWLYRNVERRDLETLMRFPDVPASAHTSHPTIEHLLPLYVTMGAGWDAGASQRVHYSYSYGSVGMASYAFGAAEDMPGRVHQEDAA